MEIKKEHQKAHKKFEDPSSKNAQYWGLVKQDAVRMADLVIRELDFMYGEWLLLTTVKYMKRWRLDALIFCIPTN